MFIGSDNGSQSYVHEAGPFSGSRSRGIPRRLRRGNVGEQAMRFTPWSASDELRRSLEFYTLAAAEFTSRMSVARFHWGLYTRDVELAAAWGQSILMISIAAARGRHSCRLGAA